MCSHICNNTKGSYKCSCHKNFNRVNNGCKASGESLTDMQMVISVMRSQVRFPSDDASMEVTFVQTAPLHHPSCVS